MRLDESVCEDLNDSFWLKINRDIKFLPDDNFFPIIIISETIC